MMRRLSAAACAHRRFRRGASCLLHSAMFEASDQGNLHHARQHCAHNTHRSVRKCTQCSQHLASARDTRDSAHNDQRAANQCAHAGRMHVQCVMPLFWPTHSLPPQHGPSAAKPWTRPKHPSTTLARLFYRRAIFHTTPQAPLATAPPADCSPAITPAPSQSTC
jgi:hypothetical protein